MDKALEVHAHERRVVRVFALDVPPAQIRFLKEEPAAIADLLGLLTIETDHVDLIRLTDLDDLGLEGYLSEGCDVPQQDLAPVSDDLGSLKGYVLVVLSRAFGGNAVTLAPKPGLSLVATFGQSATDWSATQTLDIESARPTSAHRISPRQARADARRIGGSIFAVFIVAIALILWTVLT